MIRWGLITFGVGMILLVLDIVWAKRKKGGITPTDRRRIMGIFWVSVITAGMVMGLIYFAPSDL